MKLVPNARRIALHSNSMRAGYLGLLCLVPPEALFWLFSRDTTPRLWWCLYVKLGGYMTAAQCKALLRSGVLDYREGLHGHFAAETKVQRLPTARDAAYVSLSHSVAIRGAGRSTATRRLNAGEMLLGPDVVERCARSGAPPR